MTLAFLCAAYDEEQVGEGDVRTVMHFHPVIAPIKIAVLPLSKKLSEKAKGHKASEETRKKTEMQRNLP